RHPDRPSSLSLLSPSASSLTEPPPTSASALSLHDALPISLAVRPDGRYLDGTFGRGGHSRLLLRQLGPEGCLLGFDKDPQAIATGQALAAEDGRFVVVQRSFAELGEEVAQRGWSGTLSGILLDLGVSSPQLDDPERGFSFLNDGPLD